MRGTKDHIGIVTMLLCLLMPRMSCAEKILVDTSNSLAKMKMVHFSSEK